MEGLKGLDNLMRTLSTLKDRSAIKIAKAAVNAGLGAMAKAARSGVNAAPVSAELKAAARKTIAKRLRKREGQPYTGKIGFAVGTVSKRKKETAHERYLRGQGRRHETRGVGVSASNIRWFVLGTAERQTEAGHRTGAVPAGLAGVIKNAVAGSANAAMAAARAKATQVLASEAAKARG